VCWRTEEQDEVEMAMGVTEEEEEVEREVSFETTDGIEDVPLRSPSLKLAIPAKMIPMTVKTLINLFNPTPFAPLDDFSINSSSFSGILFSFSCITSDFFFSRSRRGGVVAREVGLVD